MMNLREFVTCSQCNRELHPTIQHEIENAMVSNYHCEQCCYSFSIYSITKTRLAEIQQGSQRVEWSESELGRNRNVS